MNGISGGQWAFLFGWSTRNTTRIERKAGWKAGEGVRSQRLECYGMQKISPKDVHILIPGTCKYVKWHDKGN
jgi:hypothetical protein